MRSAILFLSALALAGCQAPNGQLAKIQTRAGGETTFHTFAARQSKATLVMFEGAGGVFDPGGPGFVNSNYSKFVERGYSAVIIEPPADQNGFSRGGGMHPRFRESGAHVRDIDAVLSKLRSTGAGPIWLLGISMGTKSVANYASRRPDRIDGAIFMSSSTRPPRAFRSVTDHDLASIRAPVLAIGHESDACRGTPPGGAREIAKAARQSVDARAVVLKGGGNFGRNPCGPGTHHTFAGIEDRVISTVSEFIDRHRL